MAGKTPKCVTAPALAQRDVLPSIVARFLGACFPTHDASCFASTAAQEVHWASLAMGFAWLVHAQDDTMSVGLRVPAGWCFRIALCLYEEFVTFVINRKKDSWTGTKHGT